MIRYLIQRPVAILLSFSVLCIFGFVALQHLPVSLLPEVDVPQITVKIQGSNTAAEALEEDAVRPLREALATLPGLKDIESYTGNHIGLIRLQFEYKTKMDLALIEANERIDRLSAQFPRDMPRPQATRVNTSDIPIVRLQIIPRLEDDYVPVSDLTENAIRRRIEQLEGVSIVDIDGLRQTGLVIEPRQDALRALGLDETALFSAVRAAGSDHGALTVRDGNYRYFVKVDQKPIDISQLPVRTKNGFSFPVSKVADFKKAVESPVGHHVFNGKPALCMTIQKQASSRMNELAPRIKEVVEQFKKDYPEADFVLTRDQTFLLQASIDNLFQDLFYGGILAVAVLFLFLGHYGSSALMSINIPLSLIITFAFFYAFGLSLNILSLFGLALGVGMMIDNSIIVIDSMARYRRSGIPATEACIKGVHAVAAPVLSQVLTTVAVYAPLVLLPGLAGLLVFDQAIALTISLGASLLIAFVLTPLLYRLFPGATFKTGGEDTRFYGWVLAGYHRMIYLIFKHKVFFFGLTCLMGLSGFWFIRKIPLTNLPQIEKTETILKINWRTPTDLEENLRRTQQLDAVLAPFTRVREAEVGIPQFRFQTENRTATQVEFYYACSNPAVKQVADSIAQNLINTHYPEAVCRVEDAPNAFTQLFARNTPWFEVRLRPANPVSPAASRAGLLASLQTFPVPDPQPGLGFDSEPGIFLGVDAEKMALYGIEWETVQAKLQRLFGRYSVGESTGTVAGTVRFAENSKNIEVQLLERVDGNNGNAYPLAAFLRVEKKETAQYITADKSGRYVSVSLAEKSTDPEAAKPLIARWANEHGLSVRFGGAYFDGMENVQNLWQVFLISLLLLYLILAVQFENLIHPLLVMLTIPLGVAGALFLLYFNGGSLDMMAAVGFIVVLGIIVDDPILKVDVINRLRKAYELAGKNKLEALEKAVHDAGEVCLKPLLMTSLTTSLALVPVLFTGGIGADLQKTFVYVIIGGLTIGTFFTTWFIPIAYWFTTKKT